MTRWSQPLTPEHDVDEFDCGHTTLNHWLRHEALRAQRSGTSRTHVWTSSDSQMVCAYYSVAPTQVLREDVPSSMTGGVSVIPAYLLGRLALDRALRGSGLGSELLFDAVSLIVAAADLAAGRLIVVDPIDDAARTFYRRHDFREIDGGDRMVMKVATARAAVRGR